MPANKRPDLVRHTVSSTGGEFIKETDIRGNQMNTNDITSVYSLGIIDIDKAIMEHIRTNIVPMVYNNNLVKIPEVVYADPEIAASISKTNVVRDSAGKIVYPIIVIGRDSIEDTVGGSQKLDANYTQNTYAYELGYTKANIYDKFSVLNNRVPVKEYKIIPIPDFIKVTYTCYVYTDFVEHNNKIIEVMKYASNSYWGSGVHSYRTNVNVIPTTVEYSNETGGRVALSQFNITTHGFILPDAIIRHTSSNQKTFSKAVVNIKIDEDF